jgi:transcriptional regulator of arginine metabolism
MKTRRQAAIVALVAHESITSQEELRRRLRAQGLAATQATLSRDIKELGLMKRAADGAYQVGVPTPMPVQANNALQHAIDEYLTGVDRAQQLVVVKTGPGQASPLAEAIDRADVTGVAGTIAGENTILVICRSPRHAEALVKKLRN